MKAASDPLSITMRALADPTRRRIMTLVGKRPMTHNALLDKIKLAQPTLSHHVKVLRKAKLIEETRVGTYTHVSAKSHVVDTLVSKLKKEMR